MKAFKKAAESKKIDVYWDSTIPKFAGLEEGCSKLINRDLIINGPLYTAEAFEETLGEAAKRIKAKGLNEVVILCLDVRENEVGGGFDIPAHGVVIRDERGKDIHPFKMLRIRSYKIPEVPYRTVIEANEPFSYQTAIEATFDFMKKALEKYGLKVYPAVRIDKGEVIVLEEPKFRLEGTKFLGIGKTKRVEIDKSKTALFLASWKRISR